MRARDNIFKVIPFKVSEVRDKTDRKWASPFRRHCQVVGVSRPGIKHNGPSQQIGLESQNSKGRTLCFLEGEEVRPGEQKRAA